MPLEWKELSHVTPMDYTITNIMEFFKTKKDPWKNILAEKQNLEEILNNISGLSL